MRLRIWASIVRRPIDSLAIVAACAVIIIIIINAVFLQSSSSSSVKPGRAISNAQEIREFLRFEERDIQSALSRVKTIFGGNAAAQNQR
jgi:preprotein translocase subunit SecG